MKSKSFAQGLFTGLAAATTVGIVAGSMMGSKKTKKIKKSETAFTAGEIL